MVPRPALVVSDGPLGPDGMLLWTVMITNAARDAWPGDLIIPRAEELGLVIPSRIRTAKVSTVETRQAARIGKLPSPLMDQVRLLLRRALNL